MSLESQISISIFREGKPMFADSIRLNRMKRSWDELVHYLFRACSFPQGCFLMTGTGIVPPNEFTLLPGDRVDITVDGIGVLSNRVQERP
jgi:2-dehydro-3-deoxy-D-arabinonate dehydratase